MKYYSIIISITSIMLFSGCGGKKLILEKINDKKYTINQFADDALYEVKPGLFYGEATVSSVFQPNDPYKKLHNDYLNSFKQICTNQNGKINTVESNELTKIIEEEYERHNEVFISQSYFSSIHEYKRFMLNKSYYTNTVKGTTAPKRINQYACKKDNKNLFYYAVSDTYTDLVSKGLSGITALWWTMNIYLHIEEE
jgi:hypothetical protein